MTPRTPVLPSDLHWQAPDRHQRALPPCGLRNDASLVAHLYDVAWSCVCGFTSADGYAHAEHACPVVWTPAVVDLNEPLPLEEVEP